MVRGSPLEDEDDRASQDTPFGHTRRGEGADLGVALNYLFSRLRDKSGNATRAEPMSYVSLHPRTSCSAWQITGGLFGCRCPINICGAQKTVSL